MRRALRSRRRHQLLHQLGQHRRSEQRKDRPGHPPGGEIYWREYGSIRCREIPHGSAPGAFQCGVKVKDAVLVVHKVLKEAVRETTPAGMREL